MLLAQGLVIEGPYIIAVLACAGTVIGVLFKLLMLSKDKEFALIMSQCIATQEAAMREKNEALRREESLKKSYKEIATEAVRAATANTDYWRQQQGKAPLLPVSAVVPESHSPATAEQTETAAIQTLRAQMEAIKVVTGQPPRIEGSDGPVSPSPHALPLSAGAVNHGSVVEVPTLPVLLDNGSIVEVPTLPVLLVPAPKPPSDSAPK